MVVEQEKSGKEKKNPKIKTMRGGVKKQNGRGNGRGGINGA